MERQVTVTFLIDRDLIEKFVTEIETAAIYGEGVSVQTAGGTFHLDAEAVVLP